MSNEAISGVHYLPLSRDLDNLPTVEELHAAMRASPSTLYCTTDMISSLHQIQEGHEQRRRLHIVFVILAKVFGM